MPVFAHSGSNRGKCWRSVCHRSHSERIVSPLSERALASQLRVRPEKSAHRALYIRCKYRHFRGRQPASRPGLDVYHKMSSDRERCLSASFFLAFVACLSSKIFNFQAPATIYARQHWQVPRMARGWMFCRCSYGLSDRTGPLIWSQKGPHPDRLISAHRRFPRVVLPVYGVCGARGR